jgi:hypothetical protein
LFWESKQREIFSGATVQKKDGRCLILSKRPSPAWWIEGVNSARVEFRKGCLFCCACYESAIRAYRATHIYHIAFCALDVSPRRWIFEILRQRMPRPFGPCFLHTTFVFGFVFSFSIHQFPFQKGGHLTDNRMQTNRNRRTQSRLVPRGRPSWRYAPTGRVRNGRGRESKERHEPFPYSPYYSVGSARNDGNTTPNSMTSNTMLRIFRAN